MDIKPKKIAKQIVDLVTFCVCKRINVIINGSNAARLIKVI